MTPRIFDADLSGLTTALDPTQMAPKLGQLLATDSGTDPSAWRVVGVELLKHKPGRRCALAYTVDGPGGRRQLFAKTFKNDRGATILVNMSSFHTAISGTSLLVPQPLGYFPEIKMLVTEFIDGRSLATALYDGRSQEPARRMAAAAAIFHACGVACARKWNPKKEIRNTKEWITGLSGRSNGPTPRARSLLDALETAATEMPQDIGLSIHRDFYPEQIRDAFGVTALLDLDDTRAGDPAIDIANFLAHLTLREIQFPEAAHGCEIARSAFVDEYELRKHSEEPGQVPFAARVRFYHATSLLRLSGVYGARERWAALVPEKLLDACEGVVTEVVS